MSTLENPGLNAEGDFLSALRASEAGGAEFRDQKLVRSAVVSLRDVAMKRALLFLAVAGLWTETHLFAQTPP